MNKTTLAAYFRNFVFGVEDSLVSTVGFLAGVSIADVPKETIFLSTVVMIFVDAFSMAAGSYLSEHSAEHYLEQKHGEEKSHHSLKSSGIMFISYFVSGFLPLIPYLLFSRDTAFWVSICVSLAALGALGGIGARISGEQSHKAIVRMVIVGGVAIVLGVVVGNLIEAGLR